jgi:hypothetical protein
LGKRRLKARDRFLPPGPRHDSKRHHVVPGRTPARDEGGLRGLPRASKGAGQRLDTVRETDHRWSVTTVSPSIPSCRGAARAPGLAGSVYRRGGRFAAPIDLPRRAVSRLTVSQATFGLEVVVRACGDG